MYEAYDRYVKNTLYDALVGYVAALTGQFKKTGSLDEETLDALCDAIETVTGYPVRIMGTKTALRKVMALNTEAHYWSEEMKNARYKDGMLGWFNGKELVAIPQVYEKGKIGEEKISNNLIWIMPINEEQFIKLVNEGDTQLKNISDKNVNMDATYEQEIQTKLGVAVMLNSVFGVYEIDA